MFLSRLVFTSDGGVVEVGVVIRSVEGYDLVKIKSDGVGSRTLILLMTPSLKIIMKTAISQSQAEDEEKPTKMFDSGSCDWLVLPLLLPTPTIQFSLDHNRRSRKQNRKNRNRKRSDQGEKSISALVLILPTPIPSNL